MYTLEVDALDVVCDFEAKKPKNYQGKVSSDVKFSSLKADSSPERLVIATGNTESELNG